MMKALLKPAANIRTSQSFGLRPVLSDWTAIVDFIEKRSLTCKWFPQFKLTDIGSIL